MSVQHVYSQTIADGTATSVVRPSDWNSNHNMVLNLGGNTAGTSQVSGQDIVWAGGNNVTLSANGSTVSIHATYVAQTTQTQAAGNIAGAGYTSTTVAGSTLGVTHNSAGLSLAQPPFITTYVNDLTSGRAGLGYTSTTVAGTSLGVTLNTNGLSMAQPLFLTTAANSTHSHNFATTTTNGANIVVGTANSVGATIGVPSFLTTAALSADSSKYAGTGTTYAGTNVNATLNVGTNGVALSLSAAGGGTINQTGPNIAVAGSTVTSGDVYFSDSPTVTFGMNGSTITASAAGGGGGAALTYLTYQNRQLGASGTTQLTNNQIWMVPFRVAGGYVSASTLQYMMSLSGTYTSAVAATYGNTMRWCIYSADATNSSVFNSASSGSLTWQVWNSGTSSGSYAIGGATSSSAGTGIMTLANGMRMMNIPIGSSVTPGLYLMAMAQSTSSAGYSALVSRYGHVVDNPMPLAMGAGFGSVTVSSSGYVDAGTYSVTSAGFPSTVNLSQIRQHSNLVPYFKMGAI